MKKYIIIFSIFLFLFNSYSLRMVTVGSGITEIIYALGIESNLVDAYILPQVMGSDHAPVVLEIKL